MSNEATSSYRQPLQLVGGLTRRGVLLVVAIVAVALTLAWFAVQVLNNMSVLRSSPQDNVHWSLAQLDVELLAVVVAAGEVSQANEASLSQLRQRFDVFYSRVQTTAAMPLFREEDLRAKGHLLEIKKKLDGLSSIIDLPDGALAARVAEIQTGMEDLRFLTRQVTLEGVKKYAEQSDATRRNFSTLLGRTALLNAVLILALAAASLFLIRQIKISRKRADALQVSSDRNASTLMASLDAIIILDMNGRIIEFNPAAIRMFGFSRHAAIGSKFEDVFIPERNRSAHRADMERLKLTGDPKAFSEGRIEMFALRHDGSEFPVEFSLGMTNSTASKMVIAYLRDISSRVEQDRQLRSARDEAVEAARAKSQFLAVMSHEMRTPLNGVMATLDLLEATTLTGKQRTYVNTALTSAEVLKQHVDDVLDLTRIQAGRLELFPRAFNLIELLEEVQAINVAAAAKNGNRIILNVDLPKPYFIADRKRIHQLLTNLVGNAIKFTRNGKIDIRAACLTVRSDVVMFEFSVRDTGIGIDAGQHELIFKEFVTLDSSYQRSASGSGLGLPICKSIVDAMNGTIGVSSSLGAGATFWFRIPLRALPNNFADKPAVEEKPASARDEKVLRVLVVEDNETNRFVAREMLEAANCEVVLAGDGEEGVRRAAEQKFDLILMDLSMPRLNGWDASVRIKGDVASMSRETPLYALTAHALPEEQADLLKAGMQGCLVKPLRTRRLQDLLRLVRSEGLTKQGILPAAGQSQGKAVPSIDVKILDELRDVLGRKVFDDKVVQFQEEVSRNLSKISTLTKTTNSSMPEVARVAHKLAGSASVFGAVQLRSCLLAMEKAAAEGNVSDVRSLLASTRKHKQVLAATLARLI